MTSHPLTVCLGKTGDILTLLPLLLTEATDGHRPSLMVSKRYADVLEGVSYVHPVVFDGEAHEVERAVKLADTMSTNVRPCQVCGPMGEIRKWVLDRNKDVKDGMMLGDSFQKSIWQLCGRWQDFSKGYPLVFDRRSPEREQSLVEKYSTPKKKLILVSTGRQPKQATDDGHFQYKDLLMLLLERFKRLYQVVDLDEVVAERFYDLLGLYERATMLIASDNAPLHLAHAVSKMPVCALISDRTADGKPSPWNGSAWRGTHVFHCRYSDFALRAAEMIGVIEAQGFPGDPFFARKTPGPKWVHVWSQYEVNKDTAKRHELAKQTWQARYHNDKSWVSCKIDRGAFGRDSEAFGMEGGRYPFLKDVLRAAALRARPDDMIVVTRADTCFTDVPLRHGWATRTMRSEDGDTYHPSLDLLVFPRATLERVNELPDLVMGPDPNWPQVVREWAGGEEIEGAVWRPLN